jgi:DNA-binding NarL/FixJ family response regulator
MSAPIRVLLCDDVPDLRMLLRLNLETDGDVQVIGEAGDGIEAVEQARDLQPDIVLLDLSMPRLDGLEAIPLIREAAPDAAIVVFSGFLTELVAKQVLEAGATSYLEKGTPHEELIGAIRAAAT